MHVLLIDLSIHLDLYIRRVCAWEGEGRAGVGGVLFLDFVLFCLFGRLVGWLFALVFCFDFCVFSFVCFYLFFCWSVWLVIIIIAVIVVIPCNTFNPMWL